MILIIGIKNRLTKAKHVSYMWNFADLFLSNSNPTLLDYTKPANSNQRIVVRLKCRCRFSAGEIQLHFYNKAKVQNGCEIEDKKLFILQKQDQKNKANLELTSFS